MTTLAERIRAQNLVKSRETDARPKSQQILAEDVNLRGSGFNKKAVERDAKAYEREVAASIKADKSLFVATAEREFSEGVEATIQVMRDAQHNSEIQYDDSQLKAIAGILHNKVSVLIGAAGTGKTTITRKIVEELAKRVAVIHLDDTEFVTAIVQGENNETKQRMLRSRAKEYGYKILGEENRNERDEEMPGIAFAAYTGRATQQLKHALPEEWHKNTSTIHKMLGYAPTFEDVEYEDPISGVMGMKQIRRFRPSFDASCKLPYQVYVLDEASMDPIPLFNEVINAIHETSRILLIGDIHQLPPVYGKSVLGYAMRKWPVFELTTIHRQAAGNAIITNAHRVLSGRSPENAENFHLIGLSNSKSPSPSGMGELQTYMRRVVKQLADMERFDPYKDAIIVPQNKSMVGSIDLNQHFVTMFNPEQKEHGVIVNKRIHIHSGTQSVYFAIRDKVMITSNINTVEPPITNGMIGIVESINLNGKYDMKRSQVETDDDDDGPEIDIEAFTLAMTAETSLGSDEKEDKEDDSLDQRQSSHVMTIKFENGQSYSCSTAGDYRRVTHGYAATCHKSQGGEYPNVIILCHSVNARMLSQEWLYTAITRARNNVYIICNNRGLDQAVKRQVIKGRTLKEKIQSYIIETGSDDEMGFDTNKYPILWEPKEIN